MTIRSIPSQLGYQPVSGTNVPKRVGEATFDTLLHKLQGTQNAPQGKQSVAAAQLLQLEMMQSTLSLTADPSSVRPLSPGAFASLIPDLLPSGSHLSPELQPRRQEQPQAQPPAPLIAASPEFTNGITRTASQYLGTPYRFGGQSAAGIDCSSFVQKVFHAHQIELPRTAREQVNVGQDVPMSELREGDLVFFHTYASYPSHVGIYLGDGKMIHASSGKGEVTISDLNSDYYRSRFVGAKRVA